MLKSKILKTCSSILLLSCLLTLTSVKTVKAASSEATIDVTSKQQIIRGFGAASVWCGALSDEKMDTLYNTMGLSVLRVRIAPNEGWSSGNYSAWSTELANAKKAVARGAIVFATPWTPPASMKTNNSVNGTDDDGTTIGSLKTSSYSSYASYLKCFADYFVANGVPLYAISLQNEPDYSPDYEACKWTADELYNFLKDYGSTIASTTKIIMPESLRFNTALSDKTLDDPTTASYVSIIGGHLYDEAVIEDYPLARSTGKELWMTEHLLNDQTLSGCLTTAKEIHDCMTIANMNAYNWWWINSDSNGLYTKTTDVVQKRGYVLGQFAKFVRSGYYRVDATSNPQSNIYVSGYTGDNKVVIVAINKGTSAVNQNFNIQNGTVSSILSWVTSATSNIEKSSSDISVSNGTFTASLPAESVTTFVGEINAQDDATTGTNQGSSVTTSTAVTTSVTSASAVKIGGIQRVGYTLEAVLSAEDGTNITTSSGITYAWNRLSSKDSNDGIYLGNDKTYNLVSNDSGNYIKLKVNYNGKDFYDITESIVTNSSSDSSGSSSSDSSGSSSSSSSSSSLSSSSASTAGSTDASQNATSENSGLVKVNNGWQKQDNDNLKYVENGQPVIGWKQVENSWYFFDSLGNMQTGWKYSDNNWYYLKDNGIMAAGWEQVGNKWYLLNNSGAMTIGWAGINDKWYFLNADGSMATSWLMISGKWYYFDNNGSMASNTNIGGYKLDKNGAMIEE